MKKALAVIVVFICMSFNSIKEQKTEQPKIFKVQSDLAGWQRVLRVVDLSKAEPEERIAVREFIIAQLNDTTLNKK